MFRNSYPFCILRRSSISFLALGGIALFVLQEKTAAGCGQPFSPPGGSWGWWWVPLKPRVRALVAHSRCWLSVSLSRFLARYFLACLIDWGGTVDRSDSCRKGDRTGITNALFCFCFCCLLSNWNFRLLASSVGLFSYSTFGFNRPLFFAYLETIIQRNDASWSFVRKI